jgi:hypothetical protein
MKDFDHPCRETCSGWRQGFEKGSESSKEEVQKLKWIISREISENDEFGSEFVIASILRQQIREALESLEACVQSWSDYAPGPNTNAFKALAHAREILAKHKKGQP